MASLREVRDGIAMTLLALDGIDVSPRMTSNPTLPAIQVFPDAVDYHQAMADGFTGWQMIVQVLVGLVDGAGAQDLLDELIEPTGTRSIKAILESNPRLGGVVDDLIVMDCTGYRVYPRPQGEPVLGAEWHVRVLD